ncbi:MAG: HEPN domain-containing protein [Proteobacteria bacterium]|nr:HEPN domain-containing protein [Pseudomonadota bacterium]
MFHLQQCAEKLLKSLLSNAKIRVLKIHDLDNLLDLLRVSEVKIIKDVEMLLPLTEYAVEGRYTIIHDDLPFDDDTRNTNRIFPESKLAKHQFNDDTYGYGEYGDACECCGKQTSCMDFAKKYGLCDNCNNRMEYNSMDLNGNHNNLLSKLR